VRIIALKWGGVEGLDDVRIDELANDEISDDILKHIGQLIEELRLNGLDLKELWPVKNFP
jgi:hypothetical protein